MQAKYGTGSIFQMPDGRWKWQGHYVDETGKKHRPSKIFRTEGQALKFQAEQLQQLEVQKAKKLNNSYTFNDIFEMWMEDVKNKKVKISETTRKNSIQNINKHILPLYSYMPITKINYIHFQRYIEKLKKQGKSPKTIYNIYSDFKKIISYAIKNEYIFEDPLLKLEIEKPKAPKKPVNTILLEEYKKITDNTENQKSWYYRPIVFLAETGLRVEELAITEDDYITTSSGLSYIIINKAIIRALTDDNKHSYLKVVEDLKTSGSVRKVPLNAKAKAIIDEQIEALKNKNIKSDFIFCSSSGKLIEKRNILRAFHTFCDNSGIEKRGLHSLRKLYINNTLQNGATPFDLSKITGHSIQTMHKYYHDLDDDLLLKIALQSEKK